MIAIIGKLTRKKKLRMREKKNKEKSSKNKIPASCRINKCVDTGLVAFHVLVLDEPFDGLLNQLLRRQEHIFKQLYQFGL